MLTRRDIRVKVMQVLYSVETLSKDADSNKALRSLLSDIDGARALPVYLLYYVIEITQYVNKVAAKKAQKFLPTEDDLTMNTKIAGNKIVHKLLENNSYKEAVKSFKTKFLIDEDMVKSCFEKLEASDQYKEYIGTSEYGQLNDKDIIRYIVDELMLDNEYFISLIERDFIHYQDDIDSSITTLKEALNQPSKVNFMKPIGAEKMDFAKTLLQTAIEKNEYCLEYITPKLRNWEADRIAVIDMILLKMGLCEILYFSSIPVKVTLNEYIELAKDYSTERSGNFVNGILDNIYKDLEDQHKIRKAPVSKPVSK